MKLKREWIDIQTTQVWPIFAYEIPLQLWVRTSGSLGKNVWLETGDQKGCLHPNGFPAGRTAFRSKRFCDSLRWAVGTDGKGMRRAWESFYSSYITCEGLMFFLGLYMAPPHFVNNPQSTHKTRWTSPCPFRLPWVGCGSSQGEHLSNVILELKNALVLNISLQTKHWSVMLHVSILMLPFALVLWTINK